MKVLIFGAGGQLGTCLQQYLSKFYEVVAVTRDQVDITDPLAVSAKVKLESPTVVVNAAAYTAVDDAELEELVCERINVEGTKNIGVAARSVEATVIHFSTDYVFGETGYDPINEGEKCRPSSVYVKTKLEGEKALFDANAKSYVLRVSWVFGEHGSNFVKTMLDLAATRSELSIVDDQIGGPTYVGDIATLVKKLAQKVEEDHPVEFGIYHYCGLPYISWKEFAEMIFVSADNLKVIPQRPKITGINSANYPSRATRPKNSKLNPHRICALAGVAPSNWLLGVQRVIEASQNPCNENH